MPHSHEVQRDPLTNCLLRPALDARMREEIARIRRYGSSFALVVMDLDHFKSINDAFGHQRGDRVLAEFARCVNGLIRASDLLFCYGGDEFVLLLPGVSRDQGHGMARRLLDHLRSVPFQGDPPLTLTLSAGVSACPEDGMDRMSLFTTADRRHYQAKRDGRARVVSVEQSISQYQHPDPPSRMIERDEVFQVAMLFLARLSYEQRGRFSISGPLGAGFSRVLSELRSIAEMQGFAVLTVQGTPALKGRRYGAISHALRSIPSLAPMVLGPPQLPAVLHKWVLLEHRRGLLVLLDDVTEMDRGTFELIQAVLSAPELNHVGVVIAEPNQRSALNLELYATLHERAALAPLSFVGIRTWLRYSLHWEPPDEIVAWLHTETGGLPGPFCRGMTWLLERHAIRRERESWALAHDYRDLQLAAHLSRESRRPPHNLLRGLPEFLGRAEDIVMLNQLLLSHRATVLIGPGGIGKTRLALQSGAECLESFPDGVFFVGLARINTVDQVPSALAEALELGGLQSTQDWMHQILEALRDRQLLLILDNLEHLPGIEALLYRLLDETHALHLLLTSRVRPSLTDAAVFELAGLDLLGSSTAQLFLQRARQVAAQFELSPHDYPAVGRICRLLEGMPLGIELAAGWAAVATCSEIAALVAGNLSALQTTHADLPERHHSMLAVLDAFWARLAPSEHAMLRRLGMIHGSFDETAARTIAGASPFFLSALLASGYVHHLPNGRYSIHELLRQYARNALQRYPSDQRRTAIRYAEYYAALTQHAFPATMSGGPALATLHQEHENILAVWEWAVAQHRIDLLHAMLPTLARFWDISGQIPVRWMLLEQAVNHIRAYLAQAPDQTDARSLLVRLLGRLAWFLALAQPARVLSDLTDEAWLHATALEEPALIADVLLTIAVDRYAREPEVARTAINEALTLTVAAPMHAECLRFHGVVLEGIEGAETALHSYTAALAAFQSCGDRLGEVRVQTNLALLAFFQGDYSRSVAYADQALHLAQTIGVVENAMVAWLMRGEALVMMADYTAAEAALRQAERLAQRHGNRNLMALAQADYVVLLSTRGDVDDAVAYAHTVLPTFPDFVDTSALLFVHLVLGHVARERQQLAEAEHHYRCARAASAHNDVPIGRPDIADSLAAIAELRGDSSAALAQVLDILELARQRPQDLFNPYLVLTICHDLLAAHEHPQATDVLELMHVCFARRSAAIDDPERRQRYEHIHQSNWPLLKASIHE